MALHYYYVHEICSPNAENKLSVVALLNVGSHNFGRLRLVANSI